MIEAIQMGTQINLMVNQIGNTLCGFARRSRLHRRSVIGARLHAGNPALRFRWFH
jgi:hypothetical protein